MWDPKNDNSQCPSGGGGVYEPQCCSNREHTTPFILYNSATKVCCQSGHVVADASQC